MSDSSIGIDDWMKLARQRIESGDMSKQEWDVVLHCLLYGSEESGLDEFDEHIETAWKTIQKEKGKP